MAQLHMRRKITRSLGGNMVMMFFLLITGVFTALPLIYSVLCAFKPLNELFLYPPRFFVYKPTWDNFSDLAQLSGDMLVPFERYLFNSVFTTFIGTAAYIFIASFAAYPLAKHKFPGRTLLVNIVVWGILFRSEVTAIPQYVIIADLKLIDTFGAVIFPALASSFGVFLIRQFMVGIPDDVLEAARIDGLGEIGMFGRIIMPMIKPAWITLIIFTFQSMWNTTGVQYIYSENMKMLPIALQQVSASGLARAGVGSAVAVILMLPPIITFLLCQSSVLETMAHSGLKS